MITLYSSHCPKCKMLERELEKQNINYEMVDDMDSILEFAKQHDLKSAPILDYEGNIMKFEDAYKFVKELNK